MSNTLTQTEETLKQQLITAVLQAGLAQAEELPDVEIEKPKEKAHGDFATNIAMKLARIAKKPPQQIAEDIISKLDKSAAHVDRVEVAGPGFINFFMKHDFLDGLIPTILEAGATYGRTNTGKGKRIQVEFVSVNPTGDLHLGHARGAAYGDVFCNVLEAAGYDVDREYYINDAGRQMDKLALSVEARYLEALGYEEAMPEDGYHGDDIVRIGKQLAEEEGDKWVNAEKSERLAYFKTYGLDYELGNLKQDLADFHVHFDNWFSEQSLYDNDRVREAIQTLEAGGYVYEQDGATWFRSTDFGDDKDRVLIKQNGNYTYLAPDIAYHKNKLERGYDQIINVWGSDHHGYISRMDAAIQALGYPEGKLAVKIIQTVNLYENGEKIRMSKRTGNAVALRDLMDEVGVDATRYFFVMRSNDTQFDFDLDLARSESNDNPIYYVQYAHARICTMLEQAESKSLIDDGSFDDRLLTSEKETDLLKKLGEFPQTIASAAQKQEPHKVTQYVFDLASRLHSFYNAEKVLDAEQPELTKARIALMKAVRVTLANGLGLIGISAPVKM